MKPCTACIERFGEPGCARRGHCVVEDVPGMSPDQSIALLKAPEEGSGQERGERRKVLLKLAQTSV